MGKIHSKQVAESTNGGRNLGKITTRRFKLGVKFGKDADGGVEAGLACGYEKKNRYFD